jgi:hypothetical protein
MYFNIQNFRRLTVRWEHRLDNFLGVLHLACAVILLRPAAFANDLDRMARFEREAQVLASLNHPNIATIIRHRAGRDRNGVGGQLWNARICPSGENHPLDHQLASLH